MCIKHVPGSFIIHSKLISNLLQTKYQGILISAHSPLTTSLNWSLPKTFTLGNLILHYCNHCHFNNYIKAAMDVLSKIMVLIHILAYGKRKNLPV